MPRYATRRISKRYAKTKRSRKSYRRPTRPNRRKSGGMTKKRILNMTSRKKRDAMLVVSNTTIANPSGSTTFNNSGAILGPQRTYLFPWIATWRDNSLLSGGIPVGNVFNQSTRTATNCYMRGLKEKIYFIQNDGSQWMWRRICFAYKGPLLYSQSTTGYSFAVESANGFGRLMNNINDSSTAGTKLTQSMIGLLFRGQVGVDFGNFFNAPTDNSRVIVKYDKTKSLATGNQNGYSRTLTRWHPMNSSLVYDDDESGGGTIAANASVADRRGMGDYYVVDLFICETPQSSSSQLVVVPESTLYWHEK